AGSPDRGSGAPGPGAPGDRGRGRAVVPVGRAVRTAARARGWPCGARVALDTLRGAGDEGEELVAVRGQLRRADARAGRQLPLGPRPARGDAPPAAALAHDVRRQ